MEDRAVRREWIEAILHALYLVMWEFNDYTKAGYPAASLPPGAYQVAEIIDEICSGKATEEDVKIFIKNILGGILYSRFVREFKGRFPWLDEEFAPGRLL
ncbi:MAG: hypothetical protein GXO29_00140 [Thermotogae bacterium]|nr:hypothetical protein [Thermotogota bacterium]